MTRVLEELAELKAQNERLEAEMQELRPAGRSAPAGAAPPEDRAGAATDGERMSRGQFLRLGAAAAAAGAVGAGGALLGAAPAGAAQGNMQYGNDNNARTFTTQLRSSNDEQTLIVLNEGAGAGVWGRKGTTGASEWKPSFGAVVGTSSGGSPGVDGRSTYGTGVEGAGGSRGVAGASASGDGVYGESQSGRGVFGESGSGAGVAARSDTSNGVDGYASAVNNGFNGVYGHTRGVGNGVFGEQANVDASGNAVLGISKGKGNSVFGYKPSNTPGDAVVGAAWSGRGVFGTSDSGSGLEGYSKTGYALKVSGKAYFSRSGVINIAAGAASGTGTLPSDGGTSIFAVLQSNVADVWVRAVVPNPAAGNFTVYLNKATPVGVRAA